MTRCAPLTNVRYGTPKFQREFEIYELTSTDYSDALWLTRTWYQPLYRSDGPAENWVLIHNPNQHAGYPETHPREGI